MEPPPHRLGAIGARGHGEGGLALVDAHVAESRPIAFVVHSLSRPITFVHALSRPIAFVHSLTRPIALVVHALSRPIAFVHSLTRPIAFVVHSLSPPIAFVHSLSTKGFTEAYPHAPRVYGELLVVRDESVLQKHAS